MSASKNIIIRGYHTGDEFQINEMFNEVFKQDRDISHWYWKYRDNPYGSYFISLAFADNGFLAAHYGGYPVKFYFFQDSEKVVKEFMTYQLSDKMTRRQYRHAGFGKSSVLTKTFLHFKDSCINNNIPFVYGFTTHHSLRFGLLFLNYTDVEPVPYRKISFDLINKIKAYRLKKIISSIKVYEVSEIDEAWSVFFSRIAPHYKYLTIRDASYLRWRYLLRPDRKYLILAVRKRTELIGWSVFYREDNKIIWGDALFDPKYLHYIKYIFCYLQKHPIAKGVDFIECWFPPRPSFWDKILQRLGFKMEAEPNGLRLTVTVFSGQKVPEPVREYFYYTIGDSDLF